VLDFGLAKRCALDEDGEPGSLSKSAEVFGTPAYASPEQLSGAETRLDLRTDVYSLGVLLYELLTGESPYGEWDGMPDLLRRVGNAPAGERVRDTHVSRLLHRAARPRGNARADQARNRRAPLLAGAECGGFPFLRSSGSARSRA